jgi:hypothetical protein
MRLQFVTSSGNRIRYQLRGAFLRGPERNADSVAECCGDFR